MHKINKNLDRQDIKMVKLIAWADYNLQLQVIVARIHTLHKCYNAYLYLKLGIIKAAIILAMGKLLEQLESHYNLIFLVIISS